MKKHLLFSVVSMSVWFATPHLAAQNEANIASLTYAKSQFPEMATSRNAKEKLLDSSEAFYQINRIQDIAIRFEQPDWVQLLDSLRINNNDNMALATVVIGGQEFRNVGVAYRGFGFQMSNKRNSLEIKLNYIDKNQNYLGIKSFKLSNALRDPSLVREVLGYEIARKYMFAPRSNFANVTVNGENRGIFANVEVISDEFLRRNFGDTEGGLFRCTIEDATQEASGCESKAYGSLRYEPSAACYLRNFEMRSKEGWDDLIELTKILAGQPNDVNKILNIDQTLWYLAFNNVCVNLFSYSGGLSNNYLLYKTKSGHFSPILGDLNFIFGSYKNTGIGSDLNLEQLQELDPLLHEKNELKPLISKVLQNPEYKKWYLSHIRQILADCFENGWYEKRVQELQKIIEQNVNLDPNKPYTMDEFKRNLTTTVGQQSKIPGIVELMAKRARFLKKHPEVGAVIPPTITEIRFSKRERFSAQMISEFRIKVTVDKFPKRVRVMWRPKTEKGDGAFQLLELYDDGQHHDGNAGDKTFGNVINPAGKFSEIEYFVVAENAAAVTFEPTNYMFEFKKANLSDLNK